MPWYSILGLILGFMISAIYFAILASVYKDCKRDGKPFRSTKRVRFWIATFLALLAPLWLPWLLFFAAFFVSGVFNGTCRAVQSILPPSEYELKARRANAILEKIENQP